MGSLRWDERPELRRPVMIAGFEGWNDAAEAASSAVDWLRRRWNSRQIASIDPEAYYDFQAVRPRVVLTDGFARELKWPENRCFAASLSDASRDAVLVSGVEPSYRWRGFCEEILTVARETGCEMVITLGALLADVPHTRPVRITGTAVDDEMARRLGLERSRYEGPTGIVGVLHDTCRAAGLPSVSLWAPVPHYVASPPNPMATLALLDAISQLLGTHTDTDELRSGVAAWQQRIDEAVAEDEETSVYVRELERRVDEEVMEEDLPTGDALAAQIEQFLREQDDTD